MNKHYSNLAVRGRFGEQPKAIAIAAVRNRNEAMNVLWNQLLVALVVLSASLSIALL